MTSDDDIREAWSRGKQAFHGGAPAPTNPYPLGTLEFAAWSSAYFAAADIAPLERLVRALEGGPNDNA